MSAGTTPAVVVDGVSKTFEIPQERMHTLKERALHPVRRQRFETLQILKEVSFAVAAGEFFGIVGRNGSGKSTLLKCLAGIYATDRGRIYVNGRVSTFIELGVGFNPDLPARDNVMINATMLGLSPREARRRFDAVVDFAELRDFVDLRLKNYSSGMLVRLAFSVMIQVDADILLIDEVLAVGDAAFQQKCFEEFGRIRDSGATVLLVTHDMGAVERFCQRALLLENGRAVEIGDPEFVGSRYLELNFSQQARAREAEAVAPEPAPPAAEPAEEPEATVPPEHQELRFGDGTGEIVDAWFEDAEGGRTEVLRSGTECSFAFRIRFNERVVDPLFGINVHNSRRDLVLTTNNLYDEPSGIFTSDETVTIRMTFQNVWAPDRYSVSPAAAHSGGGLRWIDRRNRMVSVMVTATRPTDALVDLPVQMRIERGSREPAAEALR